MNERHVPNDRYGRTRVHGAWFQKRTDLPKCGLGPGAYSQYECECGALVNGAGLALYNHARSKKHAAAKGSI